MMHALRLTTAANGLWVVPGSHAKGKLDISELVDETASVPADPARCR